MCENCYWKNICDKEFNDDCADYTTLDDIGIEEAAYYRSLGDRASAYRSVMLQFEDEED